MNFSPSSDVVRSSACDSSGTKMSSLIDIVTWAWKSSVSSMPDHGADPDVGDLHAVAGDEVADVVEGGG